MNEWTRQAQSLIDDGAWVVSVHVESVRGSAPRDAGTVMLVTAERQFGTIGGGQLEYSAIDAARQWQPASDQARQQTRRVPLGSGCGQCCGGVVTLAYEYWDARNRDELDRRVDTPRPSTAIFGSGHVGRALAQVLITLDHTVMVIDNRAEALQQLPDIGATPVLANNPVDWISHIPEHASVIVMTHDHDLDFALCAELLGRTDWTYFGLIGSRTKARRFEKRLRTAGFSDADWQRIVCPVGQNGPNGKHPGEIAIAIATEMLETRNRQSLRGVA